MTIVARDPRSAITPLTVSEVARAAVRAGICVLPPRQDGSKAPEVASWKAFQRRLPTERELDHWYDDPRRSGIIYVCGRVSGGLELLDFDDRASAWDDFQDFQTLVDDNGLSDVWDRVTGGYLERTPGGGSHVLFRSSNPTGALKLAQRPKRPEEMQHPRDTWQVLIETKGEGGYVVVAPSNGTVHRAGGSYELLRGGVDSIITITAEERDSLLAVARMLDQKPRSVYGTVASGGGERRESSGDQPGDCYNAETTWEDLLPAYGWRLWKRQGGTTHWTRPGKAEGTGATTGHQGKDVLYIFTSSTELDPDRSYDRFGFYAVMEHGGDFRAAAGALRRQGYGAPDPDTSTPNRTSSGTFVSGTDTESSHAVSWPLMAPLPALMPPVPTMPADMIPEPFRARVVDVADLTKVPLEMVGAPMVVAAGAVIGRGIGIHPWPYSDFVTVPNVWGNVIARPGWIKSGSIGEAFSPLGRLATAERTLQEAEDQRLAVRRERIAAEIDAIKRTMRDAARTGGEKEKAKNTEGTSLDALEDALRGKLAELKAASRTERRYLTHDATVEKLGALLTDNPRGMLVLRDELSGWLQALDKPGREGDREFYLEAWNGTGSYTVDRISRGTIHIPSLTLSVFGGIQPGKLQSLVASAVHGGFGDDGLLQRFQLTVWPDHLPPWVKPTRRPDNDARDRVNTVFEILAAMAGETVGATNDDIPYLRFSPGAQTIADTWRDALEHLLRSGELDETPAFASHIAKYRSLMPELALIFALIDMAAKVPGTNRGAVSEQHVRLSIRWCAFLEAHARKIYTEEMNSSLSAAHALAEKIRSGAVVDGQTVRDLYRHHWAGLRTPERVLAGLIELTDLGWVRVDSVLTGGRSSPILRLHPDLLETPVPDDSIGEA